MTPNDYIATVKSNPETLGFITLMDVIAAHYNFTPTAFTNGDVVNNADQNQGSCKLFAFARLHGLTDTQTLACFGEHYRSVRDTPNGTDHQNIRNFMKTGWGGVSFDEEPLASKG